MTPLDRAHAGSLFARTYLMCPPDHFTVSYAINPWMDPALPVDLALARDQWERLRATYAGLGHAVHVIDPEPGLPDMVFAANGATVIGGKVLGARFRHAERHPESVAYLNWFRRSGYRSVTEAAHVNEGEGDIVYAHTAIIAGHGFRTERSAHDQIEAVFGLPVISVRLVDPRFYHLDTCFCPLPRGYVMYYPNAFSPASQSRLRGLIPWEQSILVGEEDATQFACNAVNIGDQVILNGASESLVAALARAGFQTQQSTLSEFLRAGGASKCLTLRLEEGL